MKYISLDIETIGLIPGEHSIIQLGAVCEDTKNILPYEEIPKYEVLIKHPIYHGTPFAMSMHPKLLLELELPKGSPSTSRIVKAEDVAEDFLYWLVNGANYFDGSKIGPITVAGKNVASFDIPHLKALPNWEKTIVTRQRVLDPSILFWEPLTDKNIPNLEECKKRAGIPITTVAHTALADSWDVVLLLRTLYTK